MDNGKFAEIGRVGPTATQFVAKGLKNKADYKFRYYIHLTHFPSNNLLFAV